MINNDNQNTFIQEFAQELNRLRENPLSFVPALEDKLNSIKNDKIVVALGVKKIVDKSSLRSAIDFLQQVSPVGDRVTVNAKLCTLANVYMFGGDTKIAITESGLDQVSFCTYNEVKKEDCYGDFDRPTEIILCMLINGCRAPLVSSELTNLGIAISNDSVYLCFTSDLQENEESKTSYPGGEFSSYVEIQDCRTGLTDKIKKYGKPVVKAKINEKLGGKSHGKHSKLSTKDRLVNKAKGYISGDPTTGQAAHGGATTGGIIDGGANYQKQSTLLNDKKHRVKLVKY